MLMPFIVSVIYMQISGEKRRRWRKSKWARNGNEIEREREEILFQSVMNYGIFSTTLSDNIQLENYERKNFN